VASTGGTAARNAGSDCRPWSGTFDQSFQGAGPGLLPAGAAVGSRRGRSHGLRCGPGCSTGIGCGRLKVVLRPPLLR